MPPRRRAAVPAGLTIAELPDAVLVAIMHRLALEERHRSVAPVCRRWRLNINDPSLLRKLDIDISASPARFLPRLRSLAEWLQVRAAAHVQQLKLKLCCEEPLVGDDLDEAKAILPAMLAACGAAGQLVKLDLNQVLFRLHLGSWVASLGRSLQHLRTSNARQSVTLGNLQPLTVLRELVIWSTDVNVRPGARLPASLSKMGVTCSAMLPQLAGLTNLTDLDIVAVDCAPDAYAPLAQLPSLRRLGFYSRTHLPACLSQLTSLEHLSVCITQNSAAAANGTASLLKAALPQLTALTYLRLNGVPERNRPPVEVAGLAHLRCFAWMGQPDQGAVLPSGPWLSSLQRLVAPASVLAGSLQQLSAARQVEQVGAESSVGVSAGHDLRIIIDWAMHRPTLQHLPALPAGASNAALNLQRCRPGLRIELHCGDAAKLIAVVDSP